MTTELRYKVRMHKPYQNYSNIPVLEKPTGFERETREEGGNSAIDVSNRLSMG